MQWGSDSVLERFDAKGRSRSPARRRGGLRIGRNVVIGSIPRSPWRTPPFIAFDNIQSVISDAPGCSTRQESQWQRRGSDHQRPAGLCSRLQLHPDYFRNPPEYYLALILFLPATDHLGHLRPAARGRRTASEIIRGEAARPGGAVQGSESIS